MCDAVEDEEYTIDGISVSDFVHPAFFESWHQPRSVQFDHLRKVSQPFQTLQNGYQIVSNGKSAQEIFGSLAKERNFRTLEVRAQHRSEYRKLMLQTDQLPDPPKTSSGSAQAAMIYHAGQFLTALAVAHGSSQVNPFPWPWQTDPPRGKQVDPFPWPWDTDPPDWARR
jgi:hypothetical protein